MSNLYIIAGPNGSGKTTFVEKFLPSYAGCMYFVNADLIAAGLSPFSPEIAAVKAGKIMAEIPLVIAREQEGLLTVLDDHLYQAITQNLEEM